MTPLTKIIDNPPHGEADSASVRLRSSHTDIVAVWCYQAAMSEDASATTSADRRRSFARVARFGRAALRAALDAVLPPLCGSCRAPIADAGGLCPACWAQVSFLAPPWCDRLGIPFVHDPGPGVLSMEAIADPPAYGRARAAVRYDGVARDLVHRLKYGDRIDLAASMGRWMARAGRELLDDADALVPVPLHWRRLWGRRFNQAAVLARAAAADRGLLVLTAALGRRRATAQQVGLSRSAREANVQGAFTVTADGKAAIRDKRLVLVDDVLTSGATVDACARVLLRAGARNVDVLVFARVVAAARVPI
jgi:ComF family protein